LIQKDSENQKAKTNLNKLSLVEKTKFAIDTPGELRGITLKGIRTPKKKKTRRVIRIGKTKRRKKVKPRFRKGSKEAKAFMARLRAKRKKK